VVIYGGPENVIRKLSATGLGLHIIFRQDSDSDSDAEPSTPRPHPLALPSTSFTPEVEGVVSDTDHTEPHALPPRNRTPTSALNNPRLRPRTENRQPKGWKHGSTASSDMSVGSNHASVIKKRQDHHSAPTSDEIEAARHRVPQQRPADAERTCIQQEKKLMALEAARLRQRAADLEREEEDAAMFNGEMGEYQGGAMSDSGSTVMRLSLITPMRIQRSYQKSSRRFGRISLRAITVCCDEQGGWRRHYGDIYHQVRADDLVSLQPA
jgi:hypothetical protein